MPIIKTYNACKPYITYVSDTYLIYLMLHKLCMYRGEIQCSYVQIAVKITISPIYFSNSVIQFCIFCKIITIS